MIGCTISENGAQRWKMVERTAVMVMMMMIALTGILMCF
jgi:hypothetical protein